MIHPLLKLLKIYTRKLRWDVLRWGETNLCPLRPIFLILGRRICLQVTISVGADKGLIRLEQVGGTALQGEAESSEGAVEEEGGMYYTGPMGPH